MDGFFSQKETLSLTRMDGKTYSCQSCGLYKLCNSPKMPAYGKFKKGILNIGEAPGETEDDRGFPFQGKTGRLLEQTYKKLGIDLFEDCLNMNAINCRPTDDHGNNIAPTNYQIECCRRLVMKVIAERKPKLIVLLGNSAVYSLIGHRWKKDFGGITKWRGWNIPDQDYKAWVCPTFHPSYVERSTDDGVHAVWFSDLKKAVSLIDKPFPLYKEPYVEFIHDLTRLDKIKESPCAFDYETTGLKPHAIGHRIVCASVATGPDHVITFHMPKKRRLIRPFMDFLANPKIEKMAHNMKFEETWSVVQLGQPVVNWMWDSMQAAHILDNRPDITSLKFQTYVNFGIVDYASEITPFLQAKEPKNANSLNSIFELLEKPGGSEKLLYYCALDSIYEYRLALLQQSEILLPF